MLHHSLIIIIDHHHVFYNIFDHNWVSLSRARVEHEINISAEEKNFKKFNLREHDRFEIIWQKDLIILRSFDKKTWSFWSLHRSFDDTNATKQIQIKNETIKTNMRQINQNECETITNDNHWVKNRLRRFKARNDQKNRLRRFEDWTIIIFLLLSCTDDVKNHCRYFSHAFTWGRDDVWIKQTNKQTYEANATVTSFEENSFLAWLEAR